MRCPFLPSKGQAEDGGENILNANEGIVLGNVSERVV